MRVPGRYHETLDRTKAEADGEDGGESTFDPEALKELLAAIQRKEHKLKLLRKGHAKIRGGGGGGHRSRSASPIVSPEAARRTSDRLSVLNGIRDVANMYTPK